MNKIYSLLLLTAITFGSCKTAMKAYEKGNYEDAVSLAVKQLQKKGYDEDTKNLLRNAYDYAIKDHEDKIRTLNASSSDTRYEKIYNEYRELQKLYQAINNSPEAKKVVNAVDYSSYVQTYKEKAGEVYFERGLALMDAGDKRSYREAYRLFNTAAKYKNDAAVKQKIKEAYDAAVVRVMIVSTDGLSNGYNNGYHNNGGYNNGYYGNNNLYNSSYKLRNFHEDLVRSLRYQGSNEFVQFVSEFDARDNSTRVDEILEIGLRNVDVGRYFDNNYSRDVSQQIVVKEIVYKPDSVVKQYATVHARINTTQRTYLSEADLIITAKDAKGNYLWSDVIRSEHRTATEFATYTGDERALSNSDRNLLNNRNNNNPFGNIRQDDIINELLRQIESEASHRFRSYYNRY
jgi:hypothetical protein